MKVEIKGWIKRYQPTWLKEPSYWFSTDGEATADTIPVCEHTVVAEVPEGEMIPERVAAIREEKRLMRVRVAEKLAELDEAEQKLLCLTNEVQS